VLAPWALVLEAQLSQRAGFEVDAMYSDDGIVLRLADSDETPSVDQLLPHPDDIEELLVEQLAGSALFATHFRENAARALLLPRRHPKARVPLWAQRIRAQNLLAVAQRFSAFPIILETYRSCMQDVFDLPGLKTLLTEIQQRKVRIVEVETPRASPFARSLVFAYVAAYMYELDAPLAERRASALTLDRQMLSELLGHDQLASLLDPDVVAQTEAELQHLAEGTRAKSADGVHDILRRLGELDQSELGARCCEPIAPIITALLAERRIAMIRLGSRDRYIAVEDAGRYRDGLGAVPPPGVADAYLEPVDGALEQLVGRYARRHSPFRVERLAQRFGLTVAQTMPVLEVLARKGQVVDGDFGGGARFCHSEVLRLLKRRTLARLRDEVAAVEAHALARFLPVWHGISGSGPAKRGRERLRIVLEQLQGLALPFRQLEEQILPLRVGGFRPEMLDELGAAGEIVWIGRGALGANDGRVALYFRDQVALLCQPPEQSELPTALHQALLDELACRGACFMLDLLSIWSDKEDPPPSREIEQTLWDLVWKGLVTNDTLLPLRALGRAKNPRRKASPAAAGRWSLVSRLLAHQPGPKPGLPSDTRKAHAIANMLLERYGVAGRQHASCEELRGGFSAIRDVFMAMEEKGKVRRGYFVEGIGGIQYGLPAAIETLRARRAPGEEPEVLLIPTIDPANPYGTLLPWPELRAEQGTPRRIAGARLALVDGRPIIFIDRGAKRAIVFCDPEAEQTAEDLRRVAPLLRLVAKQQRGRYLRLERIDGKAANQSPLMPIFREIGFEQDYKGLVLEAMR
jgi:ATP-dependent Lhr-like helicase